MLRDYILFEDKFILSVGFSTCELPTDDSLPQSKTETKADGDCVMSLVKLTRSGLLLLTFPTEKSPDTVNIVANVFQSLSSGSLKSPM